MEADEVAQNFFKHLQRAQLLMEVARWREALHELNQHLAEFPDNYFALCQSAICHLELKEYQIALDVTKRAIEASPEDEWAYRLQSSIYTANGEPQRALEAAKTCIQKDPGSPAPIECLFWAQANYGALEDAEITLKSLMEVMPGTSSGHEAAGFLALKRKHYSDAEKHYIEALKLDPESINALNNLGVVYLDLAQSSKGLHYKQKSLEMFERAVKVQPTFKLAQQNISSASNAIKVGAPAGLFFLVWMVIKAVSSASSAGSTLHPFDALSLATPVTPSYLLTALNLYSIVLFIAVLAGGISCLVPRYREVVFYHLATVRGWLFILASFGVAAILYIVGFWVLDSRSTPFSSLAFGISPVVVFVSTINFVIQVASRRGG